MDNLAYP